MIIQEAVQLCDVGGRRFEPLIKRERTATYVLLPMVLCDLFYMDDIRHGLKLNSKTFFDIQYILNEVYMQSLSSFYTHVMIVMEHSLWEATVSTLSEHQFSTRQGAYK